MSATAASVARHVRTLDELGQRLDIAGGFAIIDRTLHDGRTVPYRTIELRSNSWNGELLGSFGEYPTESPPLRFSPSLTIPYGEMAPVIAALRRCGVQVEEPA